MSHEHGRDEKQRGHSHSDLMGRDFKPACRTVLTEPKHLHMIKEIKEHMMRMLHQIGNIIKRNYEKKPYGNYRVEKYHN